MIRRGPGFCRRSTLLAMVGALLTFASLAPAAASVCTLADHIRSANTNTAVGFCPAGTSHDIIAITEDITLTEALPPITGTITIEGGGHTISGGGEFRIFDVNGGNLTIKNLTMRDGTAEFGGAIRLRGGSEVVISHSTLSHNSAVYGGAIWTSDNRNRLTVDSSSFLNNRAERHAGALELSLGTVAISNSSFMENYSGQYGGVITNGRSTTRIENSTFYNNSAHIDAGVAFVFGGDIAFIHVTMANNFLTAETSRSSNTITKQAWSPEDSTVSLHNSIVAGTGRGSEDCFGGLDQYSGNLSTDGSCGYEPSADARLGDLTGSPAYLPLLDQSPAVDTADPEFCLETDQIGTARPQGGRCDIGAIESTTAMPGPTPTPTICNLADQIIAANTDRAYGSCRAGNGADTIYMVRDYVLSEPLEEITTDITIEGNGHTIDGNTRFRIFDVDGGKLTINNATLTKGRGSRFGGAISLQNGGTVIANNVTFIDNRSNEGGAIGSFFSAYIEVNNSSFIRNRGLSRGGAIGMNGGGFARISNSSFVENAGAEGGAIGSMSGEVAVSNSSFVGNRAGKGGALWAGGSWSGAVPVTLTHVTMLDNSTAGSRGVAGSGIHIDSSRHTNVALRLRNSVIAGAVSDRAQLCVGRLTQNLNSLIEDGSCDPMLTGDPMMEASTDAPEYMDPKAGSPAIGAADPRFCLETDQLGAPRPQGGGCDIGAIESPNGGQAQVEPATSETDAACAVTTTHALNFRDEPQGARIGLVPSATTLVARARTADWFNVNYRGVWGWVSADYVVTQGACG